jgi:hypothetical protein
MCVCCASLAGVVCVVCVWGGGMGAAVPGPQNMLQYPDFLVRLECLTLLFDLCSQRRRFVDSLPQLTFVRDAEDLASLKHRHSSVRHVLSQLEELVQSMDEQVGPGPSPRVTVARDTADALPRPSFPDACTPPSTHRAHAGQEARWAADVSQGNCGRGAPTRTLACGGLSANPPPPPPSSPVAFPSPLPTPGVASSALAGGMPGARTSPPCHFVEAHGFNALAALPLF